MGFYIQVPKNTHKAEQIVDLYNAEIIPPPQSWSEIPKHHGLVCVVENSLFDAAAYCYSEEQFLKMTRIEDGRPKTWLLMDKLLAEDLSGYRVEMNKESGGMAR